MFDSLKLKFAGTALGSLLKTLATDPKTKTTAAGLLAGAILVVPRLDLTALISGDPNQVANVLAGLLVAGIGALAGRRKQDGNTTMMGVIAGALQAHAGDITGLVTGVTLAFLGYVTNKPMEKSAPK